jgi:hypothetical protein
MPEYIFEGQAELKETDNNLVLSFKVNSEELHKKIIKNNFLNIRLYPPNLNLVEVIL